MNAGSSNFKHNYNKIPSSGGYSVAQVPASHCRGEQTTPPAIQDPPTYNVGLGSAATLPINQTPDKTSEGFIEISVKENIFNDSPSKKNNDSFFNKILTIKEPNNLDELITILMTLNRLDSKIDLQKGTHHCFIGEKQMFKDFDTLTKDDVEIAKKEGIKLPLNDPKK